MKAKIENEKIIFTESHKVKGEKIRHVWIKVDDLYGLIIQINPDCSNPTKVELKGESVANNMSLKNGNQFRVMFWIDNEIESLKDVIPFFQRYLADEKMNPQDVKFKTHRDIWNREHCTDVSDDQVDKVPFICPVDIEITNEKLQKRIEKECIDCGYHAALVDDGVFILQPRNGSGGFPVDIIGGG